VTDSEVALRDRVCRWPADPSWRELTVDRLCVLTNREGIDFATALLYDRLVTSCEHGAFIRNINALEPPRRLDLTLALVPGACHVEYPHTGADGRRLLDMARGWGCDVETVPVASFGSLDANARTICDWLTAHTGGPLVLVSLSKGGADVKTALTLPGADEAFRHVSTWVNLSGITQGTPWVSWYRARRFHQLMVRLLCWYRRYDFAVFESLDRREDRPLASAWQVPDPLRIIHVLGFSLREHLSSRLARRSHRRLACWGPNDGGGILLGDVSGLPGQIYPVWGADHYMQPAWDVRPLIGRILRHAQDTGEPPALCRRITTAGINPAARHPRLATGQTP
jgi:hypothetical protein